MNLTNTNVGNPEIQGRVSCYWRRSGGLHSWQRINGGTELTFKKTDRSKKYADILEKSSSRRYPNLEFHDAIKEKKQKLHVELQRSKTNKDPKQCMDNIKFQIYEIYNLKFKKDLLWIYIYMYIGKT